MFEQEKNAKNDKKTQETEEFFKNEAQFTETEKNFLINQKLIIDAKNNKTQELQNEYKTLADQKNEKFIIKNEKFFEGSVKGLQLKDPDLLTKPEIELIISEVLQEIQNFEDEFENKQQILNEKEKKVLQKAEKLEKIKESLEKSSKDLNDLLKKMMPKIELESKNLESLYIQLINSQKYLKAQELALKEQQIKANSLIFSTEQEKFREIQKELEQKFKILHEKESEIEELASVLQMKMKELIREEECFNQQKIEFKSEHEEKMKEIEEARIEMMALQEKLDLHLDKIEKIESFIWENKNLIVSGNNQ